MTSTDVQPLALPDPIEVNVPGRGTLTTWDSGDSPDLPVVLLLHGWNVDAPLTFGGVLPAVNACYRTVMFDMQGHGSGVRSDTPFRLEHCATDALSVMDALEIDRFTAVGYSLGASAAQLLALRAPQRCEALVLAASAANFSERRSERAQFVALRGAATAMRRLPERARQRVFHQIAKRACRRYPKQVLNTVLAADPVSLLEAGAELGDFDSSTWLGQLDQPSVVIITERDRIVPPERQRRLARGLPNASLLSVDADHDLPVHDVPTFAEAICSAVDQVSAKIPEPALV